jgi:hypothetical protein
MTPPQNHTLALRVADDDEADAVRRLAELDSAPTPTGEILLAVVDGEPVAALSLSDGRVVADPFRRTADVVALLEIRAAQMLAAAARSTHRLGANRRYPRVISHGPSSSFR